MKIIELTTKEQFDALKPNDIVITEWKEGSIDYKLGKPITFHHIYKMHNGNELILDKKKNTYFNVDMFLRKESSAKTAHLVVMDS